MLAPRLNGVGLMKRWKCANRNPATPAYSAAMTNTARLRRTVSIPTLSPISRAPFSVRIARPMRLSSRAGGHRHHDRNDGPDHAEVDAPAFGGQRADAQRRNVADAVEAVQQRQRAEQREEADAPCHRNQRQEVAGQPRGDQPEQPGGRAGNDKADDQARRSAARPQAWSATWWHRPRGRRSSPARTRSAR